MIIGRDISHLVRDVHVPVNAGNLARNGTAAADIDQQLTLAFRVLLVITIMGDGFQLGAEKLFRPVTLLASLLGRPQVVHRRRNRPRIFLERD